MSITFNNICTLLESVERVSTLHPRLPPGREKSSIRQIICNWFADHRETIDHPSTNGGAMLSALLPHRRKDRVYGLQQPLLSKKITKLVNFNHGQRLLFDRWKERSHGDLGACTEKAMKPWDGTFSNKQPVSIEKVDQLLVQLAAKYRFSDPAIRKQRDWSVSTDTVLKNILIKLESYEAKWLVRLILRNYCTIELDEELVIKQFHFLLPSLLLFQNDFDAALSLLRRDLHAFPSIPEAHMEESFRIEAAKQLKAVVGIKVGRPTFHKAWSFKNCFQLVGNRAWAADIKYDGEYCETHVDLESSPNDIQIFSKNGKDATSDRQKLHGTIRQALRIGETDCMFKKKCIVLGELVIYSDKEQRILDFSSIRKHVSRSGSFIGNAQDSLPHEWEHLMIVFFDVLLLDDKPVMRDCLQKRRDILRKLIRSIPGRAMRSEWCLVDFKSDEGVADLKDFFARTLANRQEGLVLKPLHSPYFPLLSDTGERQPGYFIKLKRDYLSDMGGERDLGDFAVVGASYDAQVAAKTKVKPLHWTHYYIGCLVNKNAVQNSGAKRQFKIVAVISLDKCIPKPELQYLNRHCQLHSTPLRCDDGIEQFEIKHSYSSSTRMAVAFKEPFVAEILGSGYEKAQNETFEMLRHPRIKKIHHDRTWEDTVTMEDLQRMAEEKWEVPDTDKLVGHARDVALLVEKYARGMSASQSSISGYQTTQETTQQSPPWTVQVPLRTPPDNAIVQLTQPTWAMASTSQFPGSMQGAGVKSSRELRVLVREDTVERIKSTPPQPRQPLKLPLSAPPKSPLVDASPALKKRSHNTAAVSPPPTKRRKIPSPFKDSGMNRNQGTFECDSQEKTIHIYVEEGWNIQVHSRR
ncbi:uncharacterized protein BDR25DRAFT_335773 [Lindgomyces ingoldianus]|uniref:Uncharacterized protein n=1 Tax=Lindgomyces ingoldianus TaxID=673940 RepID=A0ACB6QM51_9PLEO|nr:uncharacterized protein BDR25DRAFT_335773 [Lindgomyces ingoldianus]KAF2468018.1 hypothetical protein BDR25DRAFT_335773 [Lindgomyces ingoldianus]